MGEQGMVDEMELASPSQYYPESDADKKLQHKEIFYKEFENFIQNTDVKRQAKCVIRQELYDKSLACLKSPRGEKFEDCRLKSWAKSKFMLMSIDGKESVYCAKTKLPVITYENMFDTIYEAHSRIGHSGRDKTRDEVVHNFAFIPYKAIEIYVKSCHHCNTKGPTKRTHVEVSCVTSSFLARVQVDLFDLRLRRDGTYTYILHLKDYFSKFCWLFALKRKSIQSVTKKLILAFSMFGSPRILHCDNTSKDFLGEAIRLLKTTFPGISMRAGRPRFPQTQGLMGGRQVLGSGGEDDAVKILSKLMEERSTEAWSKLLPDVMNTINNHTSSAKRRTAYEIVFGQKPQRYSRFYDTLNDLEAEEAVPVVETIPSTTAPAIQNMEPPMAHIPAPPMAHVPAPHLQASHIPTSHIPNAHVPVFQHLQYGAACYSH